MGAEVSVVKCCQNPSPESDEVTVKADANHSPSTISTNATHSLVRHEVSAAGADQKAKDDAQQTHWGRKHSITNDEYLQMLMKAEKEANANVARSKKMHDVAMQQAKQDSREYIDKYKIKLNEKLRRESARVEVYIKETTQQEMESAQRESEAILAAAENNVQYAAEIVVEMVCRIDLDDIEINILEAQRRGYVESSSLSVEPNFEKKINE